MVKEVEEEGVVVEHVLEDVPGEGVGFACCGSPRSGWRLSSSRA